MTTKSKKILEAALKLTERERIAIAERLLANLSLDEDEPFADSWEEELDRRLAESEETRDPGIPWPVLRRLR
jgi:putative addiction module component (TIGR02574 family)